MTRKRAVSRTDTGLPHIERSMLRDHADPACIERVWERLDEALGDRPARQPQPRRRAWPLIAAAAAAGFVVGLSVAARWQGPPPKRATVVVEPAADEPERDVFAAGRSQRSYPLPGGGRIDLSPGTIVDTLHHGGDGLTLRLIRGEATLTTRSNDDRQRSSRLALMVGGARVATAAGSMRVRLDGAVAKLRVIDGSASVTAPDPERGLKHTVLGPNEHATVPVRIISASTQPTTDGPHPIAPGNEPLTPIAPPGSDATETAASVPKWLVACDNDDYQVAVELLGEEPGGAQAAMAKVRDPKYLSCIASGYEAKRDHGKAKEMLSRVVTEFYGAREPYAATAASNLERIYRIEGDEDTAQYYASLQQELSAGSLLSEDALCKKIGTAARVGHDEAVIQLGEDYRSQYPDGDCRDKVEQLVAEAESRHSQVPSAPASSDDPYPDDGPKDAPAAPAAP